MTATIDTTVPRVSIVVLTHNRKEEVCATLRRLTALSAYPDDLPIIVVDNASTDGTAQRIADEFPQIEVVSALSNLGAAGRNVGVQRVSTDYVAFSDDDTAWSPVALERAADILDAHPDIAVLNAHILVGPQARDDPACETMAASPLNTIEGVGPQLVGFMAGASVMRTASFRQAGGYWSPLFIGGEETLLALDILELGGRIVYAPAVVTHHWPSPNRDVARRRSLTARNEIWTAWLRFPVGMALRRSVEVFKNVRPLQAKWQLLVDVLRGLSLIWRYRRPMSASVRQKVEQVSPPHRPRLSATVHGS